MIKKTSKFCITFAGAVGCSKTPIAYYLSAKLGLPIFNNDAIRSEVMEDLGAFDTKEHLRRRDARLGEILESGRSFICDASVDRLWVEFRDKLLARGYLCFVISLDLSREFLQRLYVAKGYTESLERLDTLVAEHDAFLAKYGGEIGVHIGDADFGERLRISYAKVREWLGKN